MPIHVDMHSHTDYSDGRMRVRDSETAARRQDIGLCITDHNEIRGSLELYEHGVVPTVPAMELGSSERLDFLLYFRRPDDLVDYYKRHVEPYKFKRFFAALNRSFEHSVPAAAEYDVVISLAHPFAPVWKNIDADPRRRKRLDAVFHHIHAVEVVNGEIAAERNRRAHHFARHTRRATTAGSDAHIVERIGAVTKSLPAADATHTLFDRILHDATHDPRHDKPPLREKMATVYQVGRSHSWLFVSSRRQGHWLVTS